MDQKDKLSKLEKRMSMPTIHNINRKKSKINLGENYKKRVNFVTLTSGGAFKAKTSVNIQIKIKIANPNQKPPAFTKAWIMTSKKKMDIFCVFFLLMTIFQCSWLILPFMSLCILFLMTIFQCSWLILPFMSLCILFLIRVLVYFCFKFIFVFN